MNACGKEQHQSHIKPYYEVYPWQGCLAVDPP